MIQFDFRQDDILAGLWDSHIFRTEPISEERTTVSYELELALENGGTAFIGGNQYPIRKYCFFCIKPGTVRHSAYPFKCLYIKFNTESAMLHEVLDRLDECFALSDGERVHSLFNALLRLYNTGGDHTLMICAKFSELLAVVTKECALSGDRAGFAIEEAKAFIAGHLDEKLTLRDIAAHVHFHPVYFHRIFKRETGMTPLECLTAQRLEKAKNDLRTTESSVSTIALACGFSSPAYFGSIFKKQTGYTPFAYRKTHGYQYLADGNYPGETKQPR